MSTIYVVCTRVYFIVIYVLRARSALFFSLSFFPCYNRFENTNKYTQDDGFAILDLKTQMK